MKSLMQCLALTDTYSVTVKLNAGRKQGTERKTGISLCSFVHGGSFRHSLNVYCECWFFQTDETNDASLFSLIPIIYFIKFICKLQNLSHFQLLLLIGTTVICLLWFKNLNSKEKLWPLNVQVLNNGVFASLFVLKTRQMCSFDATPEIFLKRINHPSFLKSSAF